MARSKFKYNKKTKEITPTNWNDKENVQYPKIDELVKWFIGKNIRYSQSITVRKPNIPANLYLVEGDGKEYEYPNGPRNGTAFRQQS